MTRCGYRAAILGGCLLASASPKAVAQVGVKAGLSVATLSESAAPRSWGTVVGVAAGLAFRLPVLMPVLAVQPELLYVEKGGRDETNDAENLINYLDVPVLLRVSIPAPVGGLFLLAGPVGSVRMSCPGALLGCDRLFRDFDAGITAGVGARLGGLSLEGRWHAGLTDITVRTGDFDTRTRTVLVLAGFSF